MNIATRMRRAEQATKARNQAALDAWVSTWLQEMPREDLTTMQAFVEAMFAGEEEKALAMMPAEDPPWAPNFLKWIEGANRIEAL